MKACSCTTNENCSEPCDHKSGRSAAHGEPHKGDSIKSYHIGEPQPFPMDAAMSILKSGLARAREAGSAEQVSERDAFEKWAMPDGMQARTDAEGNYCDVGMSAGWSAWQARAALQHTAPAPSDELERLRGHLTLMPEDEAAFPDAFNVAVIRIDRYWQLREAEEKATAPSKAGEWNAAIEAAAKFVKGRLAGRAEGSDLWLEVGKIERGIRALSSAPAQAAQSEKGGEA